MRAYMSVGGACLLLVACSDAPTAPGGLPDVQIEPTEIELVLAISGGIAGVQFTLILDGEDGVVRGEACVNGCDFEPGEILGPISSAQIEAIAFGLERGGIFELSGRDLGALCCDFFDFDVLYANGSDTAGVRGTSALFPEAIATELEKLMRIADGLYPAIMAFQTAPSDWPVDAAELDGLTLEGQTLAATFTFSGGCEEHPFDLVLWGGWLESFPVQVQAIATHDDRDDACDAVITESVRFDLGPIAAAYRSAYRVSTGTVEIHITFPDGDQRTVEYTFD